MSQREGGWGGSVFVAILLIVAMTDSCHREFVGRGVMKVCEFVAMTTCGTEVEVVQDMCVHGEGMVFVAMTT